MYKPRVTYTGILDVMAGCYTCHGDEVHWREKNAMAVAARHHDATGHPTWAQQVVSVSYGKSPARQEAEAKEAASS